jgi:mRNA-degrading endonuclease toxin of MazEF toxin-antitoxin module
LIQLKTPLHFSIGQKVVAVGGDRLCLHRQRARICSRPPYLRIDVEPTRGNGLTTPSQIMVDKAWTIPSRKISRRIGRLDRGTLLAVERALASFFGIG